MAMAKPSFLFCSCWTYQYCPLGTNTDISKLAKLQLGIAQGKANWSRTESFQETSQQKTVQTFTYYCFQIFSMMPSNRNRGNNTKLHQRMFRLGIRKWFFTNSAVCSGTGTVSARSWHQTIGVEETFGQCSQIQDLIFECVVPGARHDDPCGSLPNHNIL